MGVIADSIKKTLQDAWDKPQEKQEDVWFYQKMLGTKFVEFVTNMETVLKRLVERLAALEAHVQSLTAEPAPAATNGAAENGHAVNGNGGAKKPAGPVDMRDMVRVGGDDGHPLTPEEQEIEERMDMATSGKIDESRYVPRSSIQQ